VPLASNIRSLLATPGRPLEAPTREEMERRFARERGPARAPAAALASPSGFVVGAADDPRERDAERIADRVTAGPAPAERRSTRMFDFGRIRVHHGPGASDAARALDARAFTVGEHIVFGAGQYRPASRAGDRLLAHELAHALQPSPHPARTIRRAPAGPFAVSGLHPDRGDEPGVVFFDRGEPTEAQAPPEIALDEDERVKITTTAADLTSDDATKVTLFGYASEEGGKADNRALIDRRIAAVNNVLCENLDCTAVAVVPKPSLECSAGELDYRFWRVVEMIPGDGPRGRGCEKATAKEDANRGLAACDEERKKVIAEVQKVATPDLEAAVEKLDAYDTDPSKEPDVAAALNKHFAKDHSKTTAKAVRDRVKAIADFVGTMDPLVKCGSDDQPTCHAGSPAAANPRRVIFCRGFFDDPDFVSLREDILIHESAHAMGFRARDRGYREERVILFLDTRQALDNATSLSLFVLDLVGKGLPLGPEEQDEAEDCGDDETAVREALAWAERWNTYAVTAIPQVYGIREREDYMARFLDAHFGRHDRAAVAGIADRYTMIRKVFGKQITITCVTDCPGGDRVAWTIDSDPPQVTICKPFRRLGGLNERIIQVYAALARLMPGVPRWQGRAYAEMARVYKEKIWGIK